MIVRMKELLLFVPSRQADDTLHRLGALGVVDIKSITRPEGESITWCNDRIGAVEKALAVLADHNADAPDRDKSRKKYQTDDPERVIDIVLRSNRYKQKCRERITEMRQQLEWYRRWGEQLEVDDLNYLQEKGIYIRLYRAKKAELSSIPDSSDTLLLPEEDGIIPVAFFTRKSSEQLPLTEDIMPTLSAVQAGKILARKKRQLAKTDLYLEDMVANIPLLQAYLAALRERLDFRVAQAGMGQIEGSISYLRGYIPVNAVANFKSTAKKYSWGYLIREPQHPEDVPVYIKNPKWITIINPVLQFVGVVPGYKEVDISIFFLMAFAVFFAMLIGDAGYGAIFLLLTFLLRKRLSTQMRTLIYVLSGATIFWGVITGTYFGSEQIAGIPFLQSLIIEEVASFGVDNLSFMMHLSFVIGAVHLTIAHGIRAVQFINSIKAISEVGWIALIWGLFFLVEMLVLGVPMPGWSSWLFAGGLVLVALFSRESPNFIKSLGLSLANLPLSLINGFSDVVSYVRLFAVGMATAVVAASFNNMILPPGVDRSPLDLVIAAFALFLGHSLNIILALMAVMVHGIRLNMLEFAGHVGIQFSGEAYKPFVLRSEQDQTIKSN